jgi:hypothetical protein
VTNAPGSLSRGGRQKNKNAAESKKNIPTRILDSSTGSAGTRAARLQSDVHKKLILMGGKNDEQAVSEINWGMK